MSKNHIKAFSPATVANVSCGFDILGFSFDTLGDTIELEINNSGKIKILKIDGYGNLSTDLSKNVCGVISQAMLTRLQKKVGLNIKLTKGILPGSGLGSSAASSAATAFAINNLFENPFSKSELVEFAMLGEELASGTAHADNVAPAIYGGLVLVRSYHPLDIIEIPVPDNLYCTVIHPKIELRTELSRTILRKQIDLNLAIKQWGNVAGLIAGLHTSNYELIGRSLEDHIIEPLRSVLIPGFKEIKAAAKNAGALGSGISGSGPSVFTLNKGNETAMKVANEIRRAAEKINIPFDIHTSKISEFGSRIITK